MDYYNKMNLCIHITIYMHSTLDNPLMIGLLLLSKMGTSITIFSLLIDVWSISNSFGGKLSRFTSFGRWWWGLIDALFS